MNQKKKNKFSARKIKRKEKKSIHLTNYLSSNDNNYKKHRSQDLKYPFITDPLLNNVNQTFHKTSADLHNAMVNWY